MEDVLERISKKREQISDLNIDLKGLKCLALQKYKDEYEVEHKKICKWMKDKRFIELFLVRYNIEVLEVGKLISMSYSEVSLGQEFTVKDFTGDSDVYMITVPYNIRTYENLADSNLGKINLFKKDVVSKSWQSIACEYDIDKALTPMLKRTSKYILDEFIKQNKA